jgi:hypothetical protein
MDTNKTAVLETKDNLLFIIIAQYVPRLVRIYPLSTELKRTSGVFAETALAGAAYYLLWYMLASHVRPDRSKQTKNVSIGCIFTAKSMTESAP